MMFAIVWLFLFLSIPTNGLEKRSTHDGIKLSSLSRKELQQLAKVNDVKANLKSQDIINALVRKNEELLTLTSNSSAELSTKPAGSKLDDTYIASLLEEQGLVRRDIYELRESIVEEANRKSSEDSSEEEARRKEARRLANTKKSDLIKGEKRQLKSSISAIFGTDITSTSGIFGTTGGKQSTALTALDIERLPPREPTQATPRKARESNGADPLEGVTLESILSYLEKRIGFAEMHVRTRLKFLKPENGPTVRSALVALRTKELQWARTEVEFLYRKEVEKERKRSYNQEG